MKIRRIFPRRKYYKKIVFRFTYLLLLLSFAKGIAQNVTIRGKAHPDYKGRIIQLFTYSDFLTGLEQKETQDTIQPDGFFELSFQTDYTQPVILKCGNVSGKIYVQPDFMYGVTLPPIDEKYDYNNGAELQVNIGIIGTDSAELNALIFDYEGLFNDFFTSDENRFLSRAVMIRRTDSLMKTCDKRYKTIQNDYFKNYVNYSIASVNASLSRGENFLVNGFIVNRPILYHHHEYMKFFNTCFTDHLKTLASSKKGQSLYNIINVKSDYTLLDDFVKDEKIFKNDSLRELVLLQNLWSFYFSPEFTPESVENILSQLNQKTTIEEHRKIAGRMLTYINKMQPGALAPGFAARSKDGTVGTLDSYKKHWVYLNFFSTANPASLKEMPKIAALKKKFGDKISFISICVDDSLKTYTNYIKTNPRFDWAIWYNSGKSFTKTAKEHYFVTGTEAYFMINPQGYLVYSPAQRPSEGIEFKFNTLFKKPARNTKTGIR